MNPRALSLSLEKALSLPRSPESHPANREAVGSYLYGRMGRAGLLTAMQTYQSDRPGLDPNDKRVR